MANRSTHMTRVGHRIAGSWHFCSDPGGWFDIGIYDLASDQIFWITSNEGDSRSPCWLNGSQLTGNTQSKEAVNWLVVTGEDQQTQIYCVDNGIHSTPQSTPDGKQVICLFSSPSKPPDLWMFDLERGISRKLTNSLPAGQTATLRFESQVASWLA